MFSMMLLQLSVISNHLCQPNEVIQNVPQDWAKYGDILSDTSVICGTVCLQLSHFTFADQKTHLYFILASAPARDYTTCIINPLIPGNARVDNQHCGNYCPGTRPTNDISIEFEIRPKFAVLWFKIYWTDHNKILHTSRQYNCHEVCKISLWSIKRILN